MVLSVSKPSAQQFPNRLKSSLGSVSVTSVDSVKKRIRGGTRISRKHQVTIPVEALRAAGLAPGDALRVEAAGAGRIVLVDIADRLARHAGAAPGVYPPRYLEELRDEWRG